MTDTSQTKKYTIAKNVWAQPMKRLEYNDLRGWPLPENEDGADNGFLTEDPVGTANTDEFLGYVSWLPFEEFSRTATSGWHIIDANEELPAPSGGPMTFGLAIEALKKGERVARAGWNGKGMFVYLVPANSYPAQTGAAKAHFGHGAMVPYSAYLAIKNVDETVSTWVPSVNDCLAEDWQIVE